ncbi:hypothetical protein SEA_EURATIS_42 [Streptomyces phage Euratis]|uniref:Uncharacterized protein n=1 Tax=Streptomyces phage Euratis TaxID=2510569 RepID=A0A411B103_9CAUD|nr:hypothetical protein SEA_EURATIS_42 [Streptomyces phage Euratis]
MSDTRYVVRRGTEPGTHDVIRVNAAGQGWQVAAGYKTEAVAKLVASTLKLADALDALGVDE